MVHLDILRDNREQKGWDFEDFDASVSGETIKTGDYTLAELCDHDDENDTYYPNYAVERKAGQDFISSITRDRKRFEAEIKRASDWKSKLLVLIEAPRSTFKYQRDFMQYRDVPWSSIRGTVRDWERYYNVEFKFCGSRSNAQREAFKALSAQLRVFLTSSSY